MKKLNSNKNDKSYFWADCIKIACVNPRIHTMNGNAPIFQDTGILLVYYYVSNGIKKFMKVLCELFMTKSGWLDLKSFKTLGFKARSFTKLKPQKPCPEMEYCHVGMNIWSDLLRHFCQMHRCTGSPMHFSCSR